MDHQPALVYTAATLWQHTQGWRAAVKQMRWDAINLPSWLWKAAKQQPIGNNVALHIRNQENKVRIRHERENRKGIQIPAATEEMEHKSRTPSTSEQSMQAAMATSLQRETAHKSHVPSTNRQSMQTAAVTSLQRETARKSRLLSTGGQGMQTAAVISFSWETAHKSHVPSTGRQSIRTSAVTGFPWETVHKSRTPSTIGQSMQVPMATSAQRETVHKNRTLSTNRQSTQAAAHQETAYKGHAPGTSMQGMLATRIPWETAHKSRAPSASGQRKQVTSAQWARKARRSSEKKQSVQTTGVQKQKMQTLGVSMALRVWQEKSRPVDVRNKDAPKELLQAVRVPSGAPVQKVVGQALPLPSSQSVAVQGPHNLQSQMDIVEVVKQVLLEQVGAHTELLYREV